MSRPYFLRIKEIAELRSKYRYWKLHLIGDLSLNSKTREMLADLWLVPLKDPKIFTTPSDNHRLVNNHYYDFSETETRQVKIGVGQLPALRHGTIFKDGVPLKNPKYITAKFKLVPKKDNQKIISAGDAWGRWNDLTRYYIPASQFQIFPKKFDAHTSFIPYPAKFLVIDLPSDEKQEVSLNSYPLNQKRWFSERGIKSEDNKKPDEGVAKVHGIIIPCMEIIRFYMTFSSQSYQEILSDGLAGMPNRFFITEKTIRPLPDGSGGFVLLSKHIADDDKYIVSRPAFDDYALSEYRRPYISSLNNKFKNDAFIPEARFPFKNEETILTVHGSYLQTGNRVYFLVNWISHCTAPLPYKNAGFFRENPGRKIAAETTEQDIYQTHFQEDEDSDKSIGEKYDYAAEVEKIKAVRDPHSGESDSDKIPSKLREQFKLLMDEDTRFEYAKTNPLREENPKTGEIIEGTKTSVKPIIYGVPQSEEIISTAPPSGSGSVTSVSIIPGIPEKDLDYYSEQKWKRHNPLETDGKGDKTEENKPQNEINPPAENDETEEPKPSQPKKNKESSEENKKLPISLEVFKEILQKLTKLAPTVKGTMISVSSNSNYFPTNTATLFPMVEISDSKKANLPNELFVAEIKGENNQYAYLMDIEAVTTKNGEKGRSFQMMLCFDSEKLSLLNVKSLRKIITNCGENDGKWAGIEDKNNKSNQITSNAIRCWTYKHNLTTAEDYAGRILRDLIQTAEWKL